MAAHRRTDNELDALQMRTTAHILATRFPALSQVARLLARLADGMDGGSQVVLYGPGCPEQLRIAVYTGPDGQLASYLVAGED